MALIRGPLIFCLSRKRNNIPKGVYISSIVDSTAVFGPIPDESVRPGGIACNVKVKAWSPGKSSHFHPPDLNLVLSELSGPTGEATYFLVSDSVVAVDDELIIRD